MKIRKAVITAAAPSQRSLPLQSLVDRDGERKAVLAILVEEALLAGAEEVCVVVFPGDEAAYRDAVPSDRRPQVTFVPQPVARGYGHAVFCARDFVGDEPFLHQVSDHIFLSGDPKNHGPRHLARVAAEQDCSVSGVQSTRENLLPLFGTVGGQRVPGTQDLYVIERVAEKPTPTEAEQTLLIPGLRAGHYLCFVGAHVFTPLVMDLLAGHVADAADDAPIPLSPVLGELAGREKYLALETAGRRYPIDTRYGLLHAQLALALAGPDRDEVLSSLCELLAQREMVLADR